MQQEYVAEWMELMDRALSFVRTGAQIRERGVRRAFQLVVTPAFDVVASWELLRLSSKEIEEKFEVAVVSWDQPRDAAKFRDSAERLKYGPTVEPTTSKHRVSIQPEHGHAMLAALDGLKLPLLPGEHPVGADGTMYEISIGNAFAGASFEWWAAGPKAWSELVDAVKTVHATLRKLVPERD